MINIYYSIYIIIIKKNVIFDITIYIKLSVVFPRIWPN